MICKIKVTSLLLACWLSTSSVVSQIRSQDSLIVKATLPRKKVEQKDGLLLKVVIVNTSDHSLQVYQKLVEGYDSDNKMNFNLIVEKKVEGEKGFKLYNIRSLYQSAPFYDSVDYIPKRLLLSKDSIIHYYHLDNVYMFDEGSYRVKCSYSNNIREMTKHFSEWYYFNVVRKVYVTKYYE